jgi:hypothetical protein
MRRTLISFTALLLCVQAQAQSLEFTGTATAVNGTIVTLETEAGVIFLQFDDSSNGDLSALLSKTLTGSCNSLGDMCIVLNYRALNDAAATSDED